MDENNPKMRALQQLKQMVEELMNEDFESSRKPALMALKVTKVEPKAEVEVEGEEKHEHSELCDEDCSLGSEVVKEVVEENPMVEKPSGDSDAVLKLKKILARK